MSNVSLSPPVNRQPTMPQSRLIVSRHLYDLNQSHQRFRYLYMKSNVSVTPRKVNKPHQWFRFSKRHKPSMVTLFLPATSNVSLSVRQVIITGCDFTDFSCSLLLMRYSHTSTDVWCFFFLACYTLTFSSTH